MSPEIPNSEMGESLRGDYWQTRKRTEKEVHLSDRGSGKPLQVVDNEKDGEKKTNYRQIERRLEHQKRQTLTNELVKYGYSNRIVQRKGRSATLL